MKKFICLKVHKQRSKLLFLKKIPAMIIFVFKGISEISKYVLDLRLKILSILARKFQSVEFLDTTLKEFNKAQTCLNEQLISGIQKHCYLRENSHKLGFLWFISLQSMYGLLSIFSECVENLRQLNVPPWAPPPLRALITRIFVKCHNVCWISLRNI